MLQPSWHCSHLDLWGANMARSVNFRGKVIVHPGAEAFVDVSGMVQPNADISQVAGLIAEAPYGEPGVLHVFADDKAARDYFGEGSPAADAVRFLTLKSPDERINQGAALVYVYKPNVTKRAERWLTSIPRRTLAGATNSSALSFTTTGAAKKSGSTNAYVEISTPTGAFDDQIKNLIIRVSTGWGKGQQRQVKTVSESSGGTWRIQLRDDQDWDIAPFLAGVTTKIDIEVPILALQAQEWGAKGELNEIGFRPTTLSDPDAGYKFFHRYDGRTEVREEAIGGTLTPKLHVKLDPTDNNLSSTTGWIRPGSTEKTTASSATATVLDAAGLSGVNSDQNRWVVITDVSFEGQSIDAAGGAGTFTVGETVTGGTSSATGLFVEETGGVVYLETVTGTFTAGETITGGSSGATRTVGTPTNQTASGTSNSSLLGRMFKIASNTTTEITLTGTGLGVAPGTGLKYRVIEITDAYIEVTGLDGLAKTLSIKFNDSKDASFNGGNGVADYATVDLTQYQTLQSLRDRLNNLPGLYSVYGDGVDPDLATSRFDFGEAADHWQADIIEGPNLDQKGTVIKDNVETIAEWVNGNIGRLLATRAAGPGSASAGFEGFADEIGGGEPDDLLGVFYRLYDGDAGISSVRKTNSTDPDGLISYEHGLEELLKQDAIRTEVIAVSEEDSNWSTGDLDVLISDFKDHLLDAEDARVWRNGYLGLKLPLEAGTYSGTTYAKGLLDWIKTVDDERLSISGQEVKATGTSGLEEWQPAWAFACQCASIQLGTDLGEGLTLKQIGATDLRQPIDDWDPLDKVQGKNAVLGALLYAKPLRGNFRIERGNTSKVSSNNLARTDINVWEIRNHVIRELSIKLEDRFGGVGVGNPGEGVRFVAPASAASIREAVATELEEMRADGIIVDSEDDSGRRLKAYQGLRVTISGDIARVRVQVFPKTALNFILIDFNFQTPVISAG